MSSDFRGLRFYATPVHSDELIPFDKPGQEAAIEALEALYHADAPPFSATDSASAIAFIHSSLSSFVERAELPVDLPRLPFLSEYDSGVDDFDLWNAVWTADERTGDGATERLNSEAALALIEAGLFLLPIEILKRVHPSDVKTADDPTLSVSLEDASSM